MHNPTLQDTSVPAPRTGRVSALTPKGLLAVQLLRLQALVDDLTDAEQLDLVAELAPVVRVARSRVASRQSSDGKVA